MNDAPQQRAAPPAPGGDGVRIAARGGSPRAAMYRLLALALIVCSLAFVTRHFLIGARSRSDDVRPPASEADRNAAEAGASPGDAATPRPSPRAATGTPRMASDDIAQFVSPGQPAPQMSEVIARLHKAGVHSGLGAFNPPGTRPPLVGLAVPEGFALPPGYVRHFQATDDGQRIEPILMFAPDVALRDSAGRLIPIPDNRVVPPGLAPPGFPIRLIRIPPPREPGFPTY